MLSHLENKCVTMSQSEKSRVALVLGLTGNVGLTIARRLVELKWKVFGVSRRKTDFVPKEVEYIACDLLNGNKCIEMLTQCKDTTHIFYAPWANHEKEEDNCASNGAMLKNLFAVGFPNLVHFVLITGTKHYLGWFETLKSNVSGLKDTCTPFKESMPRAPGINFYYTLEDIMYDEASQKGFTWSIARPHAIVGFAPGSHANTGTSLAVYASICKYLNIPFTFPGSSEAWSNLYDATDARLLADHCIWEATTPEAKNNAFNVVNGDVFRWQDLWTNIADYFELSVGEYKGRQSLTLKTQEFDKVWDEMVETFALKPYKLEQIASFWLNDIILGLTEDVINDMTKSRELGFLQYKSTMKSYTELFDELRAEKYIP